MPKLSRRSTRGITPEPMSRPMTHEELDKIQTLCDRASPGPWRAWIEGRDHAGGGSFIQTGAEDIELSGATEADHDLIACAREALPRLVEELRRLRAAVAEE